MLEIRWHARGGQGVKTTSQVLAQAALAMGTYVQAFPEYGPERSGAPMKVFNRISGEQIKIHCNIYNPDIVVVVDDSLLGAENVDVTEGLRPDGVLLVNTRMSAEEVRAKTGFPGQIIVIDADKLAQETGCGFANVPLLGALARIIALPLEAVQREMGGLLGKKFSEKVVQANLAAIEAGYNSISHDFHLPFSLEAEIAKREGVHVEQA